MKREEAWKDAFERLVEQFSSPPYKEDLLRAKTLFFEKIGRHFESREEYYEAVSLSFLEWYFFDRPLQVERKTPAVITLSLSKGRAEDRRLLEALLFHHWSLFEVDRSSDGRVFLKDLLVRKERTLVISTDSFLWKAWKREKGQILQARLFPRGDEEKTYFVTHYWIHPDSERKTLKEMAEKQALQWSWHRDFLKSCFECLLRSLSLQDQMRAARAKNWLYQDLEKKYAKAS